MRVAKNNFGSHLNKNYYNKPDTAVLDILRRRQIVESFHRALKSYIE